MGSCETDSAEKIVISFLNYLQVFHLCKAKEFLCYIYNTSYYSANSQGTKCTVAPFPDMKLSVRYH